MNIIKHNDQFLTNATDLDLEQAIAENHKQLFCLNTEVLKGDIVNDGGLIYTWDKKGGANIAFPMADRIADKTAEHTTLPEKLDLMMEFYRSRGADNVGCWSLGPSPLPGLAESLLARGFQPGWQPCWMALETADMKNKSASIPGLTIVTDNKISIQEVKDLPYGDGGIFSDELFHQYPLRVQRFLAYLNGGLVGQCCLFFSAAPHAVAGMYNVGVIPSMQRKGIGSAIVLTACSFAKELGYHYVTLNANDAGRPVYERAGFRFIGFGLTWWLIGKQYISKPAAGSLIKLATLVANGDLLTLQQQAEINVDLINQKLSNGFTLIDIAVQFRQHEAANWLISAGATITALSAWDLGWPDRAAELIKTEQEKNRRYFDWQGSLLHVAAQRNDTSLAKFAIDAGVDLEIRDSEHDSTGLGWAEFFSRPAIIALIKTKMNNNKPE